MLLDLSMFQFSGLRNVYADMYSSPPDEKRRELFHCPVQSTVRVEGKLLYVLYTEQLVYMYISIAMAKTAQLVELLMLRAPYRT